MASNPEAVPPGRIVILMPLRDDWISAAELAKRLDAAIRSYPCTLHLVLVDDGSVTAPAPDAFVSSYTVIQSIQILHLRRNLGHQRAIALGLVHLFRAVASDAVLVMDADGEDIPEGALDLICAFDRTHGRKKAVFAERSRRTESILFRVFYRIYKALHLILTGIPVRVGNFSILPAAYLGRLVVMSELWNHYAAAVFRSGLPISTVPIPRGYRISGKSTMNFVSLTIHGISAISVFGDVVGVRLLLVSVAGSLLALVGIAIIIAIRLFTEAAIPGWATFVTGILMLLLMQFVTMAVSFTFTMLSNRVNQQFVPLRDYEPYLAGTSEVKLSV